MNMHSQEDEHTIGIADMPPQGHALKPENDEAQIDKQLEEQLTVLGGRAFDKGWKDAIAQLRDMGHEDAARDLEKLSA
jgi:hypothetical protein